MRNARTNVKTTLVATLLVGLAAIVFVPSASAGQNIATEIEVLDGGTVTGGDFLAYGLLHSDKAKCIRDRKMLMSVDPGTGFQRRDDGVSSNGGAWSLIVEDDDATGIRVKVKRRRLPDGAVCTADSADVAF